MSNYLISRWGEDYFSINSQGHIEIKPDRKSSGGDLYELMKSLVAQGIEPPILVRFNGIIRDRIQMLHEAFHSAIDEYQYRAGHKMVFPIKVNPHRHVVETVQQAGRDYGMGLEVGSKPELIAISTLEENPHTLLLCNGYKDAEYIEMALMAGKLGSQTIIIVEQAYELKLILDTAQKIGITPQIGFRMKLSSLGSGRWKTSGGEHSKFGLFPHEILDCIEILKEKDKSDCVKLLHFHLGSQMTAIDSIKKALKEASRMYVELAPSLPGLSYFDVGGGLAVDYDGSKTDSDSSMNYTPEEYARDVVSAIGEACILAEIPDPTIITECGRALVAHHSVLILEVIDVSTILEKKSPKKNKVNHEVISSLEGLKKGLSSTNFRETLHDVLESKETVLEAFIYGKLTLHQRAEAEQIIGSLLDKLRHYRLNPEEKMLIDQLLKETYFCNFSVFQSLPDSWAIQQLFPIMPIHRLNEEPTHQAVLADLSCDSDGKIDFFIGENKPSSLPLHSYTGEPYYIGIFLVGAYQEILGGLHNLFGDTNVVHAEWNADSKKWELSRLVEGDTIEEVLHYVQYNTDTLKTQLHERIEQALKAGRITLSESAQLKKLFKHSLESYTYLVV